MQLFHSPSTAEETEGGNDKLRPKGNNHAIWFVIVISMAILAVWWCMSICRDSPPLPEPRLVVETEIAEASIYIDGKKVQSPGIVHTLGEHTIRVENQGYKPFEARIVLAVGEQRTVHVFYPDETRPPAKLVVHANIPKSTVRIDGKEAGVAGPDGHPYIRLAGKHIVRVEKQGYEPFEADITLIANEQKTIHVDLIPKPAQLAVQANVTDAMVSIDEKEVGPPNSARLHTLSAGEHIVRMESPDQKTLETPITLVAGERHTLHAMLSSASDCPAPSDCPVQMPHPPLHTARTKKQEAAPRKNRTTLVPDKKPTGRTNLPPPLSVVFEIPDQTFRDLLKDGSKGPLMRIIPKGEFRMGSPENDPGRASSETPRHRVHISKKFALSVTEVTFEDYDRFARVTNRRLPADLGWGRGKQPVINITWQDANGYADWLSDHTGRQYRLPTEAEWEYAARAGNSSRYFWGDEENPCAYANGYDKSGHGSHNYPWPHLSCDDEWENTAPVMGRRLANKFGLFDMSGNVWEWTKDCWHANYRGAPTDGSAWEKDNHGNCFRRVIRGGSWHDGARHLRSANRLWSLEDKSTNDIGFRVARNIDPRGQDS
uniref:Formylglycine-generating enzyme, required for sulfatase activity, contains SUMF1/FGE domain n=1 Tax=Candidatus Kentrum sp. FW TaxID=2126338 RepID=A0A450SY95_9GAMM|nr:MAG: Formylglycine-generating enzyme, required for sulfatase activity, contains SUMF1/FGE domain [Candidatus Kentron sp. FW]